MSNGKDGNQDMSDLFTRKSSMKRVQLGTYIRPTDVAHTVYLFSLHRKIKKSLALEYFLIIQTTVMELYGTLNYARKTNMSPEHQWLEDVFPIEIIPF